LLVALLSHKIAYKSSTQFDFRKHVAKLNNIQDAYKLSDDFVRHNLSIKCRKIVKFVSITHSERNFRNSPIVATVISREKRKPVLEGKAASPTERSWCVLEFARCNSFVAFNAHIECI
jgi:hypothetical protein